MKDNILKRLKTECPFPQVFEDLERSEDGFTNVPRRKIGHLRADYAGGIPPGPATRLWLQVKSLTKLTGLMKL